MPPHQEENGNGKIKLHERIAIVETVVADMKDDIKILKAQAWAIIILLISSLAALAARAI